MSGKYTFVRYIRFRSDAVIDLQNDMWVVLSWHNDLNEKCRVCYSRDDVIIDADRVHVRGNPTPYFWDPPYKGNAPE
jgi:hypothetical protein